jgi:hypothetical protein
MCLNETYSRIWVGEHLSDVRTALFYFITQWLLEIFDWCCWTTYLSQLHGSRIQKKGFLTAYNLLVMDNYIILYCIILVDSVMNLVATCIHVCMITLLVSHLYVLVTMKVTALRYAA